MDAIEGNSEIIARGVKYRARRRYRDGHFGNPYGDARYLKDVLQAGMSEIYRVEMEELLTSKVCPCCGQFTMQDLDW